MLSPCVIIVSPMALNIKKLETLSHPPVTSVKFSMKVRRLTTEDSSRSDYAMSTSKEKLKEEKEAIEDKEIITPIKKLDLL